MPIGDSNLAISAAKNSKHVFRYGPFAVGERAIYHDSATTGSSEAGDLRWWTSTFHLLWDACMDK